VAESIQGSETIQGEDEKDERWKRTCNQQGHRIIIQDDMTPHK